MWADQEHGLLLPDALNVLLAPGGVAHVANHIEHDGHEQFLCRMEQVGFVAIRESIEMVQESGRVRVSSYVRQCDQQARDDLEPVV